MIYLAIRVLMISKTQPFFNYPRIGTTIRWVFNQYVQIREFNYCFKRNVNVNQKGLNFHISPERKQKYDRKENVRVLNARTARLFNIIITLANFFFGTRFTRW